MNIVPQTEGPAVITSIGSPVSAKTMCGLKKELLFVNKKKQKNFINSV
jgi:hypothetical protein